MGRSPCCDKSKVKRGTWSPEEDATLRSYLLKHGTATNWIALPQKAGLRRCGKSCRLRWLNYLRPDIKHGAFTPQEEHIICDLYKKIGSRWSVIASQLQGRTDNDVKNFWNTKLKKKLIASDNTTPPTNCNSQNGPTASTTAVSLDRTTTSVWPSINSPTFQEPDSVDNSPGLTASYKPTNCNFPRVVLEGSSTPDSSLKFFQSHQDLSTFRPYGFGVDDQNYEVSIDDEYSGQFVGGFWSQEDVFGADSNADLFSIFQCYER